MKANHERRYGIQSALQELKAQRDEWTDENVIKWCLNRGMASAIPVKQCVDCLHFNEPLASKNCASCIHGGNVENNFVALGREYE